jgi:hypothetical protein
LESTTAPSQIELFFSEIDPGDTILLPGDPTPRRVTGTWFVGTARNWAIQVEEGANGRDEIYLFSSADERKATLVERPGYGPFNRRYEVGDKVYYRFGQRDNQFGVVIAYDEDPLNPDHRAYEIRSATTTGYAGPESMRHVDQPAYAVGQRWRCATNGRHGTVIGLEDEIGLLVTLRIEETGFIGTYVLSSPFWQLDEDAPKA